MSSIEYATIFDHAAAAVKSACGSTPEVNRILMDFRRRAIADEKNPLENRELMIEPMHDAQVLEVPTVLVEKVAAELQRLNVLHIWVRATCPSSDDDTLTVIETDSPRIFRETLASSCPHCGQIHEDIDWDHLETFYAFHYDRIPDKFKFSNFFRKPQSLPSSTSARRPLLSRVATWLREGPLSCFFAEGLSHPVKR